MDKREVAAIIGAYTGIAAGPVPDIQTYAERVLGRPVWTHEFGTRQMFDELKEASRADFLRVCEWLNDGHEGD